MSVIVPGVTLQRHQFSLYIYDFSVFFSGCKRDKNEN